MANILTAAEAAIVLRCETTDPDMLQLLPLVDDYIKDATGRDWTADAQAQPKAKTAARILITLWHENPGMVGNVAMLPHALTAVLLQLEAKALELASAGVPDEELALAASQPVDGASGVAIAANLTLIFNHPMASGATIAVSVETAAGAAVACTNTLDGTGKIMTINPDSNLAAGTAYTLVITAAADIYGQTLTQDIGFNTA